MAISTKVLVNRFVALDQKRKNKEGEVAKLKEELSELEPQIKARFEEAGIQSMKTSKGVTIFIQRQLWANHAEGCEAPLQVGLRCLGLGDMVKEKVNTQTLSSYVREQEEVLFNGKRVPPEELIPKLPGAIQLYIKVIEKFDVKTRKS